MLKKNKKILFLPLFLLFAILYFTARYHETENNLWPHELENQYLTVQGEILSLPENAHNETQFLFQVNAIKTNLQIISQKRVIKLYWQNAPENLQTYNKLQLLINVKRPHGYANPGGFNESLWALANHISGIGRVVNSTFNQVEIQENHWHIIEKIRYKINHNINSILNNNPLNGFIKALIIGDRSDITPEQWQVFNNTGTNHLVAIAGLHIEFLCLFFYLITGFIWRKIPYLALSFSTQQAKVSAMLIAAFLYSLLSGFLIPTQRALVMMCVYGLTFLWRRHKNPWLSYLYALIAVFLWDPLSIMTESFWLSFSALFLITYGFYGRNIQGKTKQWLWLQLILSIGLLPLTILYFEKISLISWIANLVAVPVVGFLVIPIVFLATLLSLFSLTLAVPLFKLALLFVQFIWLYLSTLSQMSFAIYEIASLSLIPVLFAFVGILLLLAPRGFPLRYFGFLGLFPLVFMSYPKPLAGNFWLTVLDVGQGLSTVVQTQHHVLIFDTGPQFGEFNAGEQIIKPYLLTQGIHQVNELVISHGDWDHRGGSYALLKAYPHTPLLTSIPEDFPNQQVSLCQAGQNWQWDGVSFQILYPYADAHFQKNNESCVLKVCAQTHCALLTGDIEAPAEQLLVQHSAAWLHSDIIIAPHHGSHTSSTLAFLAAVQPKYVVFPVGYFNRFDFPDEDIVNRYESFHAFINRTDRDGAVRFAVNGQVEKQVWFWRANLVQ